MIGCGEEKEARIKKFYADVDKINGTGIIATAEKGADGCKFELETTGSPLYEYILRPGEQKALDQFFNLSLECSDKRDPNIKGALPEVSPDEFRKSEDNMQPYLPYCGDDSAPEHKKNALKRFC